MVISKAFLSSHNVRDLGNGDQVVVLGHGFGSDQSMWRYIVPSLLSNNLKIVLFDIMGAGTTDPEHFSSKSYSSLQAHADDLLAVLRELDIVSCVYVGHSMSGMIGCLASIQRPEIFRKLILLATSPRYLNDRNYYGGFEQHDLDQLFANIKFDFKSWVSVFAPGAVGGDIDDKAVQEFFRTLLSMRPDIVLSTSKTIFQSDLRSILPEVTVPCHIIQSRKDLAVPVEVAEYLSRNLGGWTSMEILQTEGHIPQLSSPELVIPVLLRCIDA
ncbi:karrikin insensitive 2 receptor CA [Physcomitrium patens]|uniref:AB hydrolase-1 domain-containing protein n=1 Tax=Physcomitrium patens TaxID=3218 RepID=A0A2K1JPZ5_PHYPA|nr:probable esterase D14L [Physcomitrium patens]PNR43614.1 hypothetical protein PHYPA_015995 [Physcomitrium patens]|eukprot:XP_024390568.1 probable esterase D14L [Physcomitrella patens]